MSNMQKHYMNKEGRSLLGEKVQVHSLTKCIKIMDVIKGGCRNPPPPWVDQGVLFLKNIIYIYYQIYIYYN